MAGQDMLSFIDLACSTVKRHPSVLTWVHSWTDRPKLEPLTPEGWFEEGHGFVGGTRDSRKIWRPTHKPRNGLHLWAPPPLVVDSAHEELLKACHKRMDTFHVVLIPRLMAPWWRKLFNKACNFTFVVSPGAVFGPTDMYEPLWVGILLPFSIHRPWSFKRAPLLVEMGRDSREMLAEGKGNGGDILRKLLKLPKTVAHLPERMACRMLHVPGRPDKVTNSSNRGRSGKPLA